MLHGYLVAPVLNPGGTKGVSLNAEASQRGVQRKCAHVRFRPQQVVREVRLATGNCAHNQNIKFLAGKVLIWYVSARLSGTNVAQSTVAVVI